MPTVLNIATASPDELRGAAIAFDSLGYIQLAGLDQAVAPAFDRHLREALGVSDADFKALLEPDRAVIFDREMRQRSSRIQTAPELSATLLRALSPLLAEVLGPIVHVSSSYHGQFKGGELSEKAKDITHYHNETALDYMEVHGAFRLHQDFTGASLPTSPSGLTLWVALNDCPESTLRLFPGSHRHGLYCHKMWTGEDPRLKHFSAPIEVEARRGTGLLFNALLFHGTGRVGAMRRVSCDVRFFPLCGFLDSESHIIAAKPIETLKRADVLANRETLLASRLEQCAFLGQPVSVSPAPLSALNWAAYVSGVVNGQGDESLPWFERFINAELLNEPSSVFIGKFHNRTVHAERLDTIRRRAEAN